MISTTLGNEGTILIIQVKIAGKLFGGWFPNFTQAMYLQEVVGDAEEQ
ncbi:hypothetical protein KSD_68960 [Ktedonobacter sp. SOSP1-85]|nr:hypothetical protein KSC_007280 [Ktedonobacter sp. SOSP1-52]GHO79125.1 hypothetical protein KSD_68960 [Ktedonobacter sp. SOSP1-85]